MSRTVNGLKRLDLASSKRSHEIVGREVDAAAAVPDGAIVSTDGRCVRSQLEAQLGVEAPQLDRLSSCPVHLPSN